MNNPTQLINLPESKTLEFMQQGVSKIRNHVIARVFRELYLIEQCHL